MRKYRLGQRVRTVREIEGIGITPAKTTGTIDQLFDHGEEPRYAISLDEYSGTEHGRRRLMVTEDDIEALPVDQDPMTPCIVVKHYTEGEIVFVSAGDALDWLNGALSQWVELGLPVLNTHLTIRTSLIRRTELDLLPEL